MKTLTFKVTANALTATAASGVFCVFCGDKW